MINNIDVTLRDGGYQNNFSFTAEYAITHVEAMVKAGVEYVEIGYRNGSFKPIPNIGLTGISPNKYIEKIHTNVPEAKLVIIAHPHNISESDIYDMKSAGVDTIRLCIKSDNTKPTLTLCELAKKVGLNVCINVTRVSQVPTLSIIEMAQLCELSGADVLYLADSNGSLLPHDIANMTKVLMHTSKISVGFHPHDNLGLAMSNSIQAVNAGATWIDSSLAGMGKGSGNLVLETWLPYLNSCKKHNSKYDLAPIFTQLNTLKSNNCFSESKRNLIDIMLGIGNLSVEHKTEIEEVLLQDIHSALNKVRSLQVNLA
ncbi:hypothetical protein NDN13_09430 [Acinetobacter sp. C32I]|uniref:hypothetical protein n=1 Tax=Acinetobacter sp. C32I TaxID=2950074 RepID=UPI002036FEDC|nr:hypothetical protein [Acinetobacter sp. C32I]USA55383.1 hypothetical protein NDN13_09430 [Acinetobacter sp. C32I]